MTLLQIMPENEPGNAVLRTEDPEKIAAELEPLGISFERWEAAGPLRGPAAQDDVLDAYRTNVQRLCERGGYRLVDVVQMQADVTDPTWPEKARAARAKFLEEHTHDEDEVRFFVNGTGCFYLHVSGNVLAVVCQEGDLLGVPQGTRHWFDMGSTPRFTAIRFFQEDNGWIGDFTGTSIASRFPTLDQLVAT